MKNYFHLFVYLSLGFLLFALYHANYLTIPSLINPGYVALSLLLLCLGFLVDAFSWHATLRVAGEKTLVKDAVASMGLSIFGKYIPGKFWVIAGRAAFIAKKYNLCIQSHQRLSMSTLLDLVAKFETSYSATNAKIC